MRDTNTDLYCHALSKFLTHRNCETQQKAATENRKQVWYLEVDCIYNTNLKQLTLALGTRGGQELSGLKEAKCKQVRGSRTLLVRA